MLEIKDVRKLYQMGQVSVEALRGVTFTINQGEFVAIMGPSGSGKSTVMNILGCLDRPTTGSYHLQGIEVEKRSDDELADIRNQKIGFVFQQFHLLPRLSLLRNVELPLTLAGVDYKVRRKLAIEALEQVGLGDRLHHRPNEISGGQKQRAAIARALINKPAIILADEPTGNLDSKTSDMIMSLLVELHQQGNTIVIVTHSIEVSQMANRVISLRDGMVQSDLLTKE